MDGSGNAYLTGYALSGFTVTTGAFQTTCSGQCVFVTKFNSAGSAPEYSSYLGGGNVYAWSIAVDSSGSAYVTGSTTSANFPTTAGAFQTGCGAGCAYVTKFSPDGSALVYSTFLGGSQPGTGSTGGGIAVDSSGGAYVTGSTNQHDFPIVQPALNDSYNNCFVSKFNPSGSALVYSTFLGSSACNGGDSIAVDGSGNAYVAARAELGSYPQVNPISQSGNFSNQPCG